MEVMRSFYTGEVYANSQASYQVHSHRLKRVLSILQHLTQNTSFLLELYNDDPALWSEMLLMLAKLSFFSNVSPAGVSVALTAAQVRERNNEQVEIARMCTFDLNLLKDHWFTLYFHTSYDPDSHPSNAPLRHLIASSQRLLKTLNGCEEERVKQSPPLLKTTGRLRRDAYRNFVHGIYSECLQNADMNANSEAVGRLFSFFSIKADYWDNFLFQAALPEGSAFRFTAPPPPPPPVSMIKMALRLLTSQNVDLATAAGALVVKFLKRYLLRPRNRDFVCVNISAVEVASNCKCYGNESQFNFLSPENFTLENLTPCFAQTPLRFRPLLTWVDPCSSSTFPTFFGLDDSVLDTNSDDRWLAIRPDMDLSVLTPEDISNWQEGVKAIAQHFATPEFWTQLSQVILNYHRCSSIIAMKQLNQIIYSVMLSFGPQPYLRRVETFLMSLLQPALTNEHIDGIAEFVGPTMVTASLRMLALGSLSWTMEARLQLFGRVLPRLLVHLEYAVQLASAYPFDQSLSEGLKHVDQLRYFMAEGIGNVPSVLPSTNGSGSQDAENSLSDNLANKILCAYWDKVERRTSEMAGTVNPPDPADSKTRLGFPLVTFFQSLHVDYELLVYSSYIWKFFCELASTNNADHLPKVIALQRLLSRHSGSTSQHFCSCHLSSCVP